MICLVIAVTILGAPVWVPAVMLAYHYFSARKFWQFSLWFLLTLVAVECVALAISVAFYRLITPWDFPVPG